MCYQCIFNALLRVAIISLHYPILRFRENDLSCDYMESEGYFIILIRLLLLIITYIQCRKQIDMQTMFP